MAQIFKRVLNYADRVQRRFKGGLSVRLNNLLVASAACMIAMVSSQPELGTGPGAGENRRYQPAHRAAWRLGQFDQPQ